MIAIVPSLQPAVAEELPSQTFHFTAAHLKFTHVTLSRSFRSHPPRAQDLRDPRTGEQRQVQTQDVLWIPASLHVSSDVTWL